MQPPTTLALTKQLGQATSELKDISGITRRPISHSSFEQNSQRDVISFLAACVAEGEAPSSWQKVGASFFFPTVITFRLSEDGEGDGWTRIAEKGTFPGDLASCSETSKDFSAGETSFFLKNSSFLLAFRLSVDGVFFSLGSSFYPPGIHGEGKVGPHIQGKGEGHRLAS